MKKLSLLPIFVLAMVILFSCDKGGNPAELAARQSAMVDSIASAQISTKRQELLATCEQNVQTAIKAKYDSLVAAMPAAKKPTTKVATPPVKKPTPPTTKPTPTPPKPAPVQPKTQVEEQKGRGGAGENVQDQKDRNGAVKVNETTGKVETNVQEQKKRGGATKVNA